MVARLALSAAYEPAMEALGLAVAEFGAVGVVHELGRESLPADHPCDQFAERWSHRDWLAAALGEIERAERVGARFVTPADPQWPAQLNDLDALAPLALRIKGVTDLAGTADSVAIVGARAATQYGVNVAQEFASELACRGVQVISGAAFGIDAAAHVGALAVDGVTIAVSAAGADRAAPVANYDLYQRIYRRGLVISEVPLGAVPNKHRFLIRNRLIAALSHTTIVVEAAVRSGALSTARHADELGRKVVAVPGPVTSAMSAGCHALIRSGGASLVFRPSQVATPAPNDQEDLYALPRS